MIQVLTPNGAINLTCEHGVAWCDACHAGDCFREAIEPDESGEPEDDCWDHERNWGVLR